MYKNFYQTASGDEIGIVFDTEREMQIFSDIIRKLKTQFVNGKKAVIYKEKKSVKVVVCGKLDTSTEYNVASENNNELRQMLGLNVCNVFSKKEIIMVQYV